jgi:hypothetical protein
MEEILNRLTPEQCRLYKEMEEQALEPKLQLTPMALKLRTISGKLDARKEEINKAAGKQLFKTDTYIWDEKEDGEINDSQLRYEPDEFEASADGKSLQIKGGKTRSEIIRENGGWLVEIVSTKAELDADADKQTDAEGNEYTNAQKTARYMLEARIQGYSGLGYENYLVSQMSALKKGRPIDAKYLTILPESSFTNQEIVAIGRWLGGLVGLGRNGSSNRNGNLRFRRSVRVKA